MQRKKSSRKKRGQALILVVVALGLFAFGAIGFAVDLSQIYAERQLAQNAADAAALAAMMSLFDGTNTLNGTFNNTFGNITGAPGSNPAKLTCGNNDNHTPCYYARQNGFDPSNGDTVYVDFWSQINAFAQEPGVQLSTDVKDPVPLLRVTITRPVRATLMRLIGGGTTNVAAQATAAICTNILPVPILVLHPYLASALSAGGKGAANKIIILGGPKRSIQVNSCAGDTTGGKPLTLIIPKNGNSIACQPGASFTWTGRPEINLSQAGEFGKGGDFGNWGIAQVEPPLDPPLNLGSGPGSGKYDPAASPILDPLLGVPEPGSGAAGAQPIPPAAQQECIEAKGAQTCPDQNGKKNAVLCPTTEPGAAAGGTGAPQPKSSCTVLYPGTYPSANVKTVDPSDFKLTNYLIFTPGLYYIKSGGVKFDTQSYGQTQTQPTTFDVYPGCPNPDKYTGCGVVFFMAANGGNPNQFTVKDARDIFLLGSDPLLTYQRIVMFADRNATVPQSHSFGGNGTWGVTGTIYLTNTATGILNSYSGTNPDGTYQSFSFQGVPASGTVNGEIIVDVLSLGGTPNITMNLRPAVNPVRQVALVR